MIETRRLEAQVFGLWAGCLLAAACGSTAAAQPDSVAQQDTATRQAYSRMLLEDHGNKNPQQGGTDSQGDNDNGSSNGQTQGACKSVTLATNPASPQTAGVNVTLTGTTRNCPHAQYQFWMLQPGGKWSVLRAFSTTPTATWHTTGLGAGTYEFDVWVRHSQSDQVEISPITNYVLQAPAPAPARSTPCTSVAWSTPNPTSPQAAGALINLHATAAGCPNPQYQFWYQAQPSGVWTVIQAYSSASSATWNTTGLAASIYNLDVWVRQSGSAAAFEAEIKPYLTFTVQTPNACSSVTWTAPSPASPQNPGAVIALSASASGCPNPLYQFWYQAQPSGTWTVIQAYSPASAALWNTTNLATGTYNLDVWVKESASTAIFDAEIKPYLTYTLQTGAACTSASLSFTPASPQTAGGKVQLNAGASGCPNPTYEFWVQAPGGQWTVLQGFSGTSSFTWDTTGLPPGTYLFDVWVRQAGNTPQWEAHISPNPSYTLT